MTVLSPILINSLLSASTNFIIYNVSKTGFDFAEQTIGVKEVLEEEDDEILVGEEAENTGPNPPMRLLEFIDQTFSFEWIALEK